MKNKKKISRKRRCLGKVIKNLKSRKQIGSGFYLIFFKRVVINIRQLNEIADKWTVVKDSKCKYE